MPRPSKLAEAAKKDVMLFQSVPPSEIAGEGVWVRIYPTRQVPIPFPVALRFAMVGPELRCTGVLFEPGVQPLEARHLREFPLGVLIARASGSPSLLVAFPQAFPKIPAAPGHRLGRSPTREELERIAARHLAHKRAGMPNPVQRTAVEEHRSISSTRRLLGLAEAAVPAIETGRPKTAKRGTRGVQRGRVR